MMQKTYTYETEYCLECDRDTVIEVRFLYQVIPGIPAAHNPPDVTQTEEPPELDTIEIYSKKGGHWVGAEGDLYEELLYFVGETIEDDMLGHAGKIDRDD